MSYLTGDGVDCSIALSVNRRESVDLSVNRADGHAWLVLGRSVAEISLEPWHLETLRDQLPGALADLGVLDVAEERATEADTRAMEMAKHLRKHADDADEAGEPERAAELRVSADKLSAAVEALRSVLAAVDDAARAADDTSAAAQRLLDALPANGPR